MICWTVSLADHGLLAFSHDSAQFRQDLFNIARTTLSSKVLSQDKNYFANLAVDAVLRLQVCPLSLILSGQSD